MLLPALLTKAVACGVMMLTPWHPRLGADSYSSISAGALQHHGYRFEARYVSPGNPLTLQEHRRLERHHIRIIVTWEYGARDYMGGYREGRLEARAAQAQCKAAGIYHAPVYFAVDSDVVGLYGNVGLHNLAAYLMGAAAVLGVHRVGLYGGYPEVRLAHHRHLASFFWQTSAWSYGKWLDAAQIHQGRGGEGNHYVADYNVPFAGTTLDRDWAVKRYYGGAG